MFFLLGENVEVVTDFLFLRFLTVNSEECQTVLTEEGAVQSVVQESQDRGLCRVRDGGTRQ